MNTDSNSAQLHHERPLNVLIVGAGIGGLSAAIALRQSGHRVEILERSRFAIETGAAIHIPPNVNGLLRRFNITPEDHGAVNTDWVSETKNDGSRVYLRDLRGLRKQFPYPWQMCHRVDLHNSLKEQATSPEGEGIPVTIHLTTQAEKVDCDKGLVTTKDGRTYSGDLVVCADGVHSALRPFVSGIKDKPHASGFSAFRCLIPVEILRADPQTSHFVERDGELQLLSAEDRRIIIYPCRNNTLLNIGAIHPDVETEVDGENSTYQQEGSKESLLKCFASFQPDVLALLSKAQPDGIRLWTLLDMAELGKGNWVRGRVALLGDAAHPFLPYQGQGGAQAIEDGAALGALFPLGTRVEDVENRLELYTEARYDRATMIQEYTRQTSFQDSYRKKDGVEQEQKDLDRFRFMVVNFSHDAWEHANGLLKK